MIRVGFGYDVHQLVEGRDLILGGVRIANPKGLRGHSDADVLSHAIGDALLGAAALGDLGTHFPDSDEQYAGISSLLLLKEIVALLGRHDYQVNNVDSTVVMEHPKLAPYLDEIRRNLAASLRIPLERISVKATTSEKMGFVGREEGVATYAVALIAETS